MFYCSLHPSHVFSSDQLKHPHLNTTFPVCVLVQMICMYCTAAFRQVLSCSEEWFSTNLKGSLQGSVLADLFFSFPFSSFEMAEDHFYSSLTLSFSSFNAFPHYFLNCILSTGPLFLLWLWDCSVFQKTQKTFPFHSHTAERIINWILIALSYSLVSTSVHDGVFLHRWSFYLVIEAASQTNILRVISCIF